MSFFRGHFQFCGELVRSAEPRIYSSRAVLITHNVALHYTGQAIFEEVSNFPTVLDPRMSHAIAALATTEKKRIHASLIKSSIYYLINFCCEKLLYFVLKSLMFTVC